MKIIIKDKRYNETFLNISGNMTIREIKNQYIELKNLPYYPVKLIFCGEIMKDDEIADYYDIEDGDIIFSGDIIRGGGGHICPYGCGRLIPDDFKGCTELLRDYPNFFDK